MQSDEVDQEQYTIWMQNAGFLYDRLMIHKLKWPCLTFQWLPYREQTYNSKIYRCLYATHSSKQAPAEHIYIAEVTFPSLRSFNETPSEISASQIKNIGKFTHQLQINRTRYCPSDSSYIAARTDEGPITLFQNGTEFPIHLMEGTLSGGFALEWSQVGVLSGDFSGRAYFWNSMDQAPLIFEYGSEIEDIKIIEESTAAIVGDKGCLSVWDMRNGAIVQNVQASFGDQKDIYSVSVNAEQRQLLLTAGQDQIIRIWDRRNLSTQLHKFEGHEDSVMSVEWSQVNKSVFASASVDKKVKIWDLMRVGFEIPKDLGGTDELLFTHQGHKGAVNDVSWHPYEDLLGSTGQDNTLQFYQMTNNIHELQYAEDMQYLRQQCFA